MTSTSTTSSNGNDSISFTQATQYSSLSHSFILFVFTIAAVSFLFNQSQDGKLWFCWERCSLHEMMLNQQQRMLNAIFV